MYRLKRDRTIVSAWSAYQLEAQSMEVTASHTWGKVLCLLSPRALICQVGEAEPLLTGLWRGGSRSGATRGSQLSVWCREPSGNAAASTTPIAPGCLLSPRVRPRSPFPCSCWSPLSDCSQHAHVGSDGPELQLTSFKLEMRPEEELERPKRFSMVVRLLLK